MLNPVQDKSTWEATLRKVLHKIWFSYTVKTPTCKLLTQLKILSQVNIFSSKMLSLHIKTS